MARRSKRLRRALATFYRKAYEDNITGLAGMVAYNLLLSVFPLALLALFIGGQVLQSVDLEHSVLQDMRQLFPTATDDTLTKARTFAEEVGKTCVEVKRDVAGFVSNRLFSALLVEAIKLVETGVVSAADLDTVMKLGFGHAMGPLATVDLTGLDVMLNAASNIYHDTADEKFFPPELLQRMVTAGHLGRKAGKGFYTY